MKPTPVAIESKNIRLQLLPSYGGRIGRLQVRSGGKFIDILCPYTDQNFDPFAWPKCGAFPLIPYSNRIRNAEFFFDGSIYRLPPHPTASPHTLHGVCHTLPWQLTSLSPNMIQVAVEYSGPHWPWPIRAEQRFTLHDEHLEIQITLKNLGQTPMPGGIGFHPYFLTDETFKAQFLTARQWTLGPDRLPVSVSPDLDQVISLVSDEWQDQDFIGHYSELSSDIVLKYGDNTLSINVSGSLRHLVGFAPKGGNYLCLEPVSHVANSLNLSGFCEHEIGVNVVPAGEILVGEVSLRWCEASEKTGVQNSLFPSAVLTTKLH